MSLVVQAIPVGAKLVDTIDDLTPTQLRAFRDGGVEGLIAYLGKNLTSDLIANWTALGGGIVPVNMSRPDGWIPTADEGASDGIASAKSMAALGIPMQGLDDWCDVEGCGADPTAYCGAWCATVTRDGSGRLPKGYAGAGALLTGHAWYMLPFRGYWHSCSRGIPEPDCGFQLDQLYPPDQPLGGTVVDYNYARRDFFGRAPTWVRAAP